MQGVSVGQRKWTGVWGVGTRHGGVLLPSPIALVAQWRQSR